jgi:hypothetical protein
MVLHYFYRQFLCQAQNEFICSATSLFLIPPYPVPLLGATAAKELAPRQANHPRAIKESNTLIFPWVLRIGEEPHPPRKLNQRFDVYYL